MMIDSCKTNPLPEEIMDFVTQSVLLALAMGLILTLLFWPETMKGPVEDCLRILSPVFWMEEGRVYEEILKLHPMFGLNEHNRMLLYLHSKGKIERHVEHPNALEEIESPNRFGRIYIDHVEPFCMITTVKYRLVQRKGGRTMRTGREKLAHA